VAVTVCRLAHRLRAAGIGAARILALGLALVTEAFPPQERGAPWGSPVHQFHRHITGRPGQGDYREPVVALIFSSTCPSASWDVSGRRNIPLQQTGGQAFDFGGAATLCPGLVGILLG
jgi:hypothetical protein